MNTEKIEKLKKTLSSTKLPADLKPKIEAEIKRLEDLDAKESEAKEEVKPVAKKTTTRKPRATKTVAKKTSTRKPSQTSKPKRTPMSLAKEIRKEGESWSDARARASKMMKEKTHTATKDVESELDKLTKLVRGKKELKGQIGRTNLLIDAKRKAKPMGRRISKDGNVYYENRANRTDRGTYGKYHLAEGGAVDKWIGYDKDHLMNMKNGMIVLRGTDLKDIKPKDIKGFDMLDNKGYAEGGYLTDPTFGNFQSQVFADGGFMDGVYANGGGVGTHKYTLSEAKNMLDAEKSKNEGYSWFVSDVDYYGEDDNEQEYGVHLTDKELLDLADEVGDNYAKGGGIRRKNGQTYDYGRVWTKDHNEFDKDADHEVNYRRKKLAKGGRVESLTKELYRLQRELNSSRLQTYRLGDNSQEAMDRKNEREVKLARFNEVLKELRESDAKFELGGVMATDLAGHTGGGDAGLNAGMPLDGFSNTSYTGLVGETGAMSSGEMFMAGGKIGEGKIFIKYDVKDPQGYYNSMLYYYFDLDGNFVRSVGDFGKPIPQVNISEKEFKKRYKDNIIDKEYKVEFKNGTSVPTYSLAKAKEYAVAYSKYGFELGGGLPNGASQSYMITESLGNPAQHFAKGGGIRRVGGREYPLGRNWTNDHEHTNKGEEHEVNYTRKGKFLGIFKDGGGIPNNYEGKTPEQVWNMWTPDQREHFLADHYDVMDGKDLDAKNKSFKSLNFLTQTQLELHIKQGQYAKGGGVRRVGNREYSLGRNWTNDHEHVNKAEEHETKYTRKKSFAGGGAIGETPKIYVADLEAYNNGRLSGVWLDLADYNDADELMEAIQDFLNTTGGEEYAIHDAEYIPSSMYSEYMGQRDFEELYEMIDLAKDNNLPLSVVQEVVSQYDASAVQEFQGKYDDAEDFAQQLVDDIGIESFIGFQYYLYISDTDRRLLAQDMADSHVDDIRDEDGGNRLIEEAGLDVDEYEEADSDRQEEMLDEAREIVYDEYYNNWYEGLSDPYYFLVEEQGMYSPDDFANATFVRVDYEKLGDALEQDYTFIYDDGELYVFNIR